MNEYRPILGQWTLSEGMILRCGSSSATHHIGTCLKRWGNTSADWLHTTLCSYGSAPPMIMCARRDNSKPRCRTVGSDTSALLATTAESQTSLRPCVGCRYVNLAVEFAMWVNTPPNKRHEFYRGPPPNRQPKQLAAVELKKIRCFSCIFFVRKIVLLKITETKIAGN